MSNETQSLDKKKSNYTKKLENKNYCNKTTTLPSFKNISTF